MRREAPMDMIGGDESEVFAEPFGALAFQAATGANATQMADLETFRSILERRNQDLNLVGPSAMAEFWLRHAFDSAQLLPLAPDARSWADLGAGAGFPGLVLAILLNDGGKVHVHLIESAGKRCRFLNEVAAALNLPVTVHNGRAEDVVLDVDVVTARAVAPMTRLIGYAWPYLSRGAIGLFLKGHGAEIELADAAKTWKFEATLSSSRSHAQGRIVQMRKVTRVRPA